MSEKIMENKDSKNKASRLLDILGKQEEVEKKEIEREATIKNKFAKLPIKEKIKILYDECLMTIKEIEDVNQSDLLQTYLADTFNIEDNALDDANLYLNLIFFKRLLKFKIIEFYFDEREDSFATDEYNLNNKWWDKMLSDQDISYDERLVNVVDKNLSLALYSNLFNEILNNADKVTYNKTKLKYKKLAFLDDNNNSSLTMEDYFLEYVERKTVENSIVMVTPDVEEFFEIENKKEEVYEFEKNSLVNFIGKWNNRFVYRINVENTKQLKGFQRGAFFINEGNEHKNKYIINPDKPLVYFNKIDNAFLERPLLKVFMSLQFKFFKSASLFLRIEDM